MTVEETRLVGWLVIARHQWTNGSACILPTAIHRELVRQGWLLDCDGSDGCEPGNAHLTDRGTMLTDLNAGDWGIDPLPEYHGPLT